MSDKKRAKHKQKNAEASKKRTQAAAPRKRCADRAGGVVWWCLDMSLGIRNACGLRVPFRLVP
jgi:hypothetical protein